MTNCASCEASVGDRDDATGRVYEHDLSCSLYMTEFAIFRQLGPGQYTEEETANFAHEKTGRFSFVLHLASCINYDILYKTFTLNFKLQPHH